MKELEITQADKTKMVKQAEIKKQANLLGSIKKIPGLTLFELDLNTGRITKAKFDDSTVNYQTGERRNKLKVKQHVLYAQALNIKNAKRKFTKKAKQLIAENNG